MNTYENTKVCKLCHCSNGLKYVEGAGCFCCTEAPDFITCYEEYVGQYTCEYCDKETYVYDEKCYILDDRYSHVSGGHIYVCEECIRPHFELIYRGAKDEPYENNYCSFVDLYHVKKIGDWRFVLYHPSDEVLKVLKKSPSFICNKCNKISNVLKGIHMVDNMNICEDCKNTFICNKCNKITNVSNGIYVVDNMNVCKDCKNQN